MKALIKVLKWNSVVPLDSEKASLTYTSEVKCCFPHFRLSKHSVKLIYLTLKLTIFLLLQHFKLRRGKFAECVFVNQNFALEWRTNTIMNWKRLKQSQIVSGERVCVRERERNRERVCECVFVIEWECECVCLM